MSKYGELFWSFSPLQPRIFRQASGNSDKERQLHLYQRIGLTPPPCSPQVGKRIVHSRWVEFKFNILNLKVSGTNNCQDFLCTCNSRVIANNNPCMHNSLLCSKTNYIWTPRFAWLSFRPPCRPFLPGPAHHLWHLNDSWVFWWSYHHRYQDGRSYHYQLSQQVYGGDREYGGWPEHLRHELPLLHTGHRSPTPDEHQHYHHLRTWWQCQYSWAALDYSHRWMSDSNALYCYHAALAVGWTDKSWAHHLINYYSVPICIRQSATRCDNII